MKKDHLPHSNKILYSEKEGKKDPLKGKKIILEEKTFIPFITKEKIQEAVKKIALEAYDQYYHTTPLFIGVLNGVIMFFSDFLKYYPGECNSAFIQLSSYENTNSTEKINVLLDWPPSIKNRDILILEDIVDTGNTLKKLQEMLKGKEVKSAKTAALFFKPDAFIQKIPIDFIGLEIPNKFVIGYGLDYNGLGRNHEELYQLEEN